MRYFILSLLLIFSLNIDVAGQEIKVSEEALARDAENAKIERSVERKKKKKGSIFKGKPGKAALYSLILPGAGQAYNKSYGRVPFVLAAVGGMGYVVIRNGQQHKCFEDVYRARIDEVEPMISEKCLRLGGPQILSPEAGTIRLYRDQSRKNKQSAIIGFAAVWLANSIDAFVNAHLKQFDISDDLSYAKPKIRVKPAFGTEYGGSTVGLIVSF